MPHPAPQGKKKSNKTTLYVMQLILIKIACFLLIIKLRLAGCSLLFSCDEAATGLAQVSFHANPTNGWSVQSDLSGVKLYHCLGPIPRKKR
jgi:hypothetical protein